jgi:hypothetical protein
MSSSDKIIDKLGMSKSAVEAMARAVPDDVVRGIVSDHTRGWAPTPPPQKSIVDQLVERFAPTG